MESTNLFNDGMQSDLSKQSIAKSSYPLALNFRPLTTLGDSTGSLVNIKGNECKISYPTMRDIYKLQVYNKAGGGGNETLTITINGQTTGSLAINNATSGFMLYNAITQLSNCFNNPAAINPTFAVAYKDNYVVIYQLPEYKDCGPAVDSSAITITFTTTIGATADYTLGWVDSTNNIVSIYPGVQTPFIITNNNLTTIGSTFIGENIYLLTSDDNGTPVADSFTGTGYIWKLSIDDITRQATLTLLYGNYLDFTKEHPVPPSAITGRFESDQIQRIYWSDFFNKIRTINVGDPQLMALDVKLLSVAPNTEFSVPILNSLISGSLGCGCYQVCYRLYQDLGSVTNYSELSELIYLIDKPISYTTVDWVNYQGGVATANSNKGLQIKIDDLDTTYDKVEVLVLYRSDKDAVPTIQALPLQPIPLNGSIIINYSGSETTTNITLDDFLNLASGFTHAKTVDTKDNRLFWGNVKNTTKSLDEYDARAFRAKGSSNPTWNDIILTNDGVTSTFNLAGAEALPEEYDTINEYYTTTGDPSSNACYYKPGTAKLGGTGVNISYEFGTHCIPGDRLASIPTTDDWMINFSGGPSSPFRLANTGDTNTDMNGALSLNTGLFAYPQGVFGTTKYPQNMGILKGFQHEEIYRFGIQFFDLQGNPYFVKWIGDIKMPSYGDYNDNPDPVASGAGYNDFRLSFVTGSDDLWLQILYIKFNVDVSSLNGKISGYEIVRVKREGVNKTINGCGIVTPFIDEYDTGTNSNLYLPANFQSEDSTFDPAGAGPPVTRPARYKPFPSQGYVETLNTNAEYSTTWKFKSFDCFDHHSAFGRPSFANGDKLLFRSRLISTNYRSGAQGFWTLFNNFTYEHGTGNNYPQPGQSLYKAAYIPGCGGIMAGDSPYDHYTVPYFLLKFKDDTINYATAANNYTFSAPFVTSHSYTIDEATVASGNTTVSLAGSTLHNYGKDMNKNTGSACDSPAQGNPCLGSQTTMIHLTTGIDLAATYGCVAPLDADFGQIYKMLALYFKWNINLYGGFTYANRTLNTYIPCSEYVHVLEDKLPINQNITLNTFGGDVYTSIYDHQKTIKTTSGPAYSYFDFDAAGNPTVLGVKDDGEATYSTTFFFPCTNICNSELRDGVHINKNLTTLGWANEDEYIYNNYQSCENDIKTYFPKPLNFNLTDQWINRVYFSELKINNETQDSWSIYKTNNFYDVEGNYGGINALISLKNQIYYIQDRGVGMLLINPVAMIGSNIGTDIKLGAGKTIEKHNYIAIDVGTKHQWSVYKSQNQICFLDVRNKKIYSFNGEGLNPISDTKGQRNFVMKRLHDNILIKDNPVIGEGILTTYDYVNNEFLFTFNNHNTNTTPNNTDEYYTIVYSEAFDKFTSYYSFTPNIYINNHKYLLSTIIANKDNLYLHNYGQYGTFYGTKYPSKLKILINDQPLSTKVLDNVSWHSESYKDNIEWSDDRNVEPGSITSPLYSDDVWYPNNTFTKARFYNNYQNTDWTTLTLSTPNNNLRLVEQQFNLQIPRNKVNYDTTGNSTKSIFDPTILTKTSFGERLRDKWFICDLEYPNPDNLRFVIHNLKSTTRVSDR